MSDATYHTKHEAIHSWSSNL